VTVGWCAGGRFCSARPLTSRLRPGCVGAETAPRCQTLFRLSHGRPSPSCLRLGDGPSRQPCRDPATESGRVLFRSVDFPKQAVIFDGMIARRLDRLEPGRLMTWFSAGVCHRTMRTSALADALPRCRNKSHPLVQLATGWGPHRAAFAALPAGGQACEDQNLRQVAAGRDRAAADVPPHSGVVLLSAGVAAAACSIVSPYIGMRAGFRAATTAAPDFARRRRCASTRMPARIDPEPAAKRKQTTPSSVMCLSPSRRRCPTAPM